MIPEAVQWPRQVKFTFSPDPKAARKTGGKQRVVTLTFTDQFAEETFIGRTFKDVIVDKVEIVG